MTPQDLIAAFDTLAEAPNAADRLRELVLQLAVRGKLVPQNPDDEPAEQLLERARQSRLQLVASGEIRAKRLPRLATDELPHEVPAGWAWAQIADCAHDLGQGEPTSRFSYVDVSAIDNEKGTIGETVAVIEPADAPSRARKRVGRGCVIYSTVRPYLNNIAVLDREFDPEPIVSTAFSVLMPHEGISARYLYFYLRSPVFVDYVNAKQKGVAYPAINDGDFQQGYVPVPPAAEQRRIVARVEELMGLLDRLEAARDARETTRQALRDSALAALQQADTHEEVETAWQRIAENIHDLFTTPADIEPLRQTVLQLAVRGRLVPQNPNDEPASALVERAKTQLTAIAAAGRTRVGKDSTEYERDDALPDGWSWAPLQHLVQFIDYRGKTPKKTASGVRLLTAKNIKLGYISLEPEEFVTEADYEKLMTRGFPKEGDVLFTTEAPMGHAALVDLPEKFALAQRTINFHPLAEVNGAYLVILLLSPWFQAELAERATGMTATGIKAAKLRLIRVPVPPDREQHRIVAQIKDLMGLVDNLEKRLAAQRDIHDAFAAAAVHHLET
ncbi:MAG: restriction endonuclease subunit S [Planctomycetes bacterium]|nr:restriction endonuclease subunit S [Planctomycetota bacterium]